MALAALAPAAVLAAEGGGSNYLQGTYGDFEAAVPWDSYFRNDVIYYDAGIGPRPLGAGSDPGFEQKLWMNRLNLGGFFDGEFLGGRFGIEVQIPYVFDLTVEQYGPPYSSFGSPRDHGFADPVIKPQLAWGSGPHYSKIALGIVVPIGTYDDSTVVSVGRNYWSLDPTFTYTFRNESGWDISATAGIMFNLPNYDPSTNYVTGDEAHIDAMIGKHFGDHFAFGIAGYWYEQIYDDKGVIPPPLEAGFKSDGAGYGPVVMFGNKNFSVVGKWLTDTHGDNRLDGDLYMLSFVARFGGEKPTPVVIAAPAVRAEPQPIPPPPPAPPPADSDGDGVLDPSDLCPATPRGDTVDVNGCSCDVTVRVNFKSNSTVINEVDAIALNSLADQIRRLPTVTGELGGHTDSQGSDAFNLDLSRRRALAARDYIASRGIDVSQMAIAGYGESRPIADNSTPEGRAENRRVTLRRTSCHGGPVSQ